MSILGKLIGRRDDFSDRVAELDNPKRMDVLPKPKVPHFVIGDLHGRADLLERMLELIDEQIGKFSITNPHLVFVGDYIDRGPSSREVLQRLMELTDEFPDHVTCLIGNHEQMMLDFLQAPEARYARWLRNGGLETCMSMRLGVSSADIRADEADTLAKALEASLGEDLLYWLRSRAVLSQSGNLVIVHAGADPTKPIDDQKDRVMIWGHPEFMTRPRLDDNWIAHGHTVVEEPTMKDSRISIDTGAWYTDKLTAVMVLPSGKTAFLQT